jgi:predicted ester cyclase
MVPHITGEPEGQVSRWKPLEAGMGKVLDTYNRYRELLFSGDFAHLTEVVDEDFVETCVGLTGWTRGLDIAAANFAAGIGAAFTDLTAQEYDHIEDGDLLAIRGRGEGTHTGRFLGLEPTGRRVWWEFADLYRLGADGRINWHFFVTDWNFVRLQLLGETPDLPATPERRAVLVG